MFFKRAACHRIAKLLFVFTIGMLPLASSVISEASPITPASLITVTTLTDGSGTCPGVACTLRAAITSALGSASATTINFNLSGTLTLASVLTINNSSSNPITIDDGGQAIAISGANTTQLFSVSSGGMLTLDNLTLQNGTTGSNPGAVYNAGTLTLNNVTLSSNTAPGGSAGALNNEGTATINGSTFSNNSAQYNGAAILNDNRLTLNNSTVFGNTVAAGNGGGVYNNSGIVSVNSSTFANNTASANDGGGFYNYYAEVTISNSTFSGNLAGGSHSGGGLFNTGDYQANVSATISNSTFANNTASNSGGGIFNDYPTTLYLFSSIVAGNSSSSVPDIEGIVTSEGHNFVGDGTGSGLQNGLNNDQVGNNGTVLNAQIGALASNGGPTQTMAALPGSPILAHGDCRGNSGITPNAPALVLDQRGVRRINPVGNGLGCGVGAFELPNLDSIGIYRGGTFYLRLHNTQGFADSTIGFNPAGQNLPVVGDWTGSGFDTVGVYNQSTGNFALCTTNTTAGCTNAGNVLGLTLGNPNDTPLAGRWLLNSTHSGAGVYRPSNGVLYLKNVLTTGFADNAMVMGLPGDQGVAGDWTDKGFDSPGIFRPSNIGYYLSNQVTNGPVFADITLTYGSPSDLPITGDWSAQVHDGVGMFRPSNGYVYIKNVLTTGFADSSFFYGLAGDRPVAGHWQVVYPPIAPSIAPGKIAPPPILLPGAGSAHAGNSSVEGGNNIGN